MEKRPTLTLVGNEKKKKIKRNLPEFLQCDKCGSYDSIETRNRRMIKNGKLTAGVREIRCYDCGNVLHQI